MVLHDFKKVFLQQDCFSDIVGLQKTKQQLKSALLVNRHVLIVGPPGVGKTTLAKNIATLLPVLECNSCDFHCLPEKPCCPACLLGKTKTTKKVKGHERFIRLQGSPDLTVEDILGDIDPIKALHFGPTSFEAFSPGKLFRAQNGILFFDELNRAPHKLQNALLQVLEEKKATIGAYTIDIPVDFLFVATMNPTDSTTTETLSDVLLDRLDVIHMSYPDTLEDEIHIVQQQGTSLEEFPVELLSEAICFIRELRENKDLSRAPSVRCSLGIYERAQAHAFLAGRTVVAKQDVLDALVSVLSQRIELKPSVKYMKSTAEFIREQITSKNGFKNKSGCL